MTLKERFKATETKAGKLLIKICAIAGVIITVVGESATYMHFIPEGFIPVWVKGTIGVIALAGVVIGKLTVHPDAKV